MIPWLFIILLLAGLCIHIALGLYSRRFRNQPVQLPFEILMYFCAIWCATFIFDISSDSLQIKILMMQVRFLALSFLTLSLLSIAIFFTGHGPWLTKRRLGLLLIIPVINVVLALTTQYSTIFRYNYAVVQTAGGFSVLGYTNGIWSSAVYLPFNYCLELVTFLLLLQVILGGQKLYARQALLFFIAVLIPVIFDILFTLGISPVQGYNIVPSTFAFTGVLLAIALFEYRFIDIVPIARTMLFEQMADPMLVIDPDGRLVDFNPAAERVLRLDRTVDVGRAATGILEKHGKLLEFIEHPRTSPETIVFADDSGTRLFEVSIEEMGSGGGIPSAKLLLLRDITERRRTEQDLVSAQERLKEAHHLAHIGTWDWVKENDVVTWSEELYHIAGRDLSLPAPTYAEHQRIYTPASWDRLSGAVTNTLATGNPYNLELELVRPDGSIRWTNAFGGVKRDLDGTITGLHGTLQDITDRKRVEESLRETAEYLRNLIDFASAPIIVWNPDFRITRFNHAFEDLTLLSEQEVVGKPLDILFPQESRNSSLALIRQTLGGEQWDSIKIPILSFDGTVNTVLWNSANILNTDGTVISTIAQGIDITRSEMTEEALRESERKYRNLYNFAQVGLFETSIKDGTIVACNQRYVEMFGFTSVEEAIGRDVLSLYVNPSERTEVGRILREQGHIDDHTVSFRNLLTGVAFWGQFSARFNYERDVAEGSIIDVTAQKEAEAHLVETNSYLTNLFDYANAPIIVWDPEFRITRFNHAFERLTGCMGEVVIGKPVDILFPGDTRDCSMAYLRQSTSGERWETVEIPILCRDGSQRIVLWNSAPLYAGDGITLIATIAQGQDISDRKQAEEALRRSENLYRSLFENMLNGFSYCRMIYEDGIPRDFTYLVVNRAFGELTGLRDVEGKNVSVVIPGIREMDPRLFEIYGRVASTGTPEQFEMFLEALQAWYSISVYSPQNGYFVAVFDVITERKQAEQALRESEARLSLTLDVGNAGMWVWDLAHDTVSFDERFHSMLGYSPGDLPGSAEEWKTYHHPDDLPVMLSRAEAYFRGESSIFESEHRIRTREGNWDWVFTRGQLVNPTKTGSPELFLGMAMNISERKEAAESLRESEEKYREFFTTSQDCVFITSPEGNWIDFNDVAMEMFGYRDREEFSRFPIQDLYRTAEDRAAFIALIGKEGYVREYPVQLKRKDGTSIATLITAVPLRKPDGSVRAFVGTIRDVSDRKKAEADLAASEEKFSKAFMTSPYAITITRNRDGSFIEVNDAFTRITGFSREEAIASSSIGLNLWVDPEDRKKVISDLLEGRSVNGEEFLFLRKDGVTITGWFSAQVISLNNEPCILSSINDITERKKAEKLREQMVNDLTQKNAELERFAYTASHDLKTPLITIRGFLGFVERDAQAGDMVRMHQDLARIASATGKMQELLDSLLELSRIGRIVGPPEPVSMLEITNESVELLAVPIQERNVTVTVAPGLPEVYGDKKRLREVMVNLVENAVKFMGDQQDPRVEIGVHSDAGKPVFFVRDNGIGIAPEYQGKLFSLFERLEVNVPGSGVGLALVKRIIEIHGGKIWVESEGGGNGTTFWFTLPGIPDGE